MDKAGVIRSRWLGMRCGRHHIMVRDVWGDATLGGERGGGDASVCSSCRVKELQQPDVTGGLLIGTDLVGLACVHIVLGGGIELHLTASAVR